MKSIGTITRLRSISRSSNPIFCKDIRQVMASDPFYSLLSECQNIHSIKQAHSVIIVHGVADNYFYLDKLIELYGRHSRIDSRGRLIPQFISHIFSPTINKDIRQAVASDPFYSLLSECQNSIHSIKQAHSVLVVHGITDNIFYRAKLIELYSRHGRFDLTRILRPRTISGISSPIIPKNILQAMTPDPLYSLLSECQNDIHSIKQAHSVLIVHGVTDSFFYRDKLMELYAEHNIDSTCLLFDRIQYPDRYSCNTMMKCYDLNEMHLELLGFYKYMNKVVNEHHCIWFYRVISACTYLQRLREGREVHCEIVKVGFQGSLLIRDLIDMYTGCRDIECSNLLFVESLHLNISTWASDIICNVMNDQNREGLSLLQNLPRPDVSTLVNIIWAFTELGSFHLGKRVHAYVLKIGMHEQYAVAIGLHNMYLKFGIIKDVHVLPNSDTITTVRGLGAKLGRRKIIKHDNPGGDGGRSTSSASIFIGGGIVVGTLGCIYASKVFLREAHEEAVPKSLAAFNASAVGVGSVRQKFEKNVQAFVRRAFEEYKRTAYMEADMKCSNTLQSMEKKLRAACHAPDAKIDKVTKLIDGMLSEYEASAHGPGKWQKLSTFLQQSLEGPILDLAKKQLDQTESEKSALALKCRSIEDKMGLLNKQLEASEKNKTEYLKRYENAINDKKALGDDYMSRITNLQGKCSSLEERCLNSTKDRDAARQESLDWKRKYEQVLLKLKSEEAEANEEIATLKSRISAAEAMLSAAREQAQSAQEEAAEWRRKLDHAVREAKAALEKAATIQERSTKQTQMREDALRAEFAVKSAEKEDEFKEKVAKLEHAEQRLTTLSMQLKTAESKVKSYDMEKSALQNKIKELDEKLDSMKEAAQSYEREARTLRQEKAHLDEKYLSEFKRFEEIQERCINAEKVAKRATELADAARAELVTAQKEKNDIQRVAMERLNQIERAERQVENLERVKTDLMDEVDSLRASEMDAVSKVSLLEARVDEREKEIESLLKSNNEQRSSTVQVLESLLETERAACAEANNRAEALSMQLQATQSRLDSLQQEMTSVRLNETALDSKLRTASHGKRLRSENYDAGLESVQDMDIDGASRGRKRTKSTNSPLMVPHAEDGGSVFRGDNDDNGSQQTETEDYTKFTVLKLKQELTKHNLGAELLKLKNPNKKDILALYEKHIVKK